jgi:hypothetical protein
MRVLLSLAAVRGSYHESQEFYAIWRRALHFAPLSAPVPLDLPQLTLWLEPERES